MAKRALIFIIALYAISIAMNSCIPRCTEHTTFLWEDFSIRVFDNNSVGFPDLDTDSPIRKTRLGFQISPCVEIVEQFLGSRTPTFSIISEAQAWSCGRIHTRLHSFTSISIKAKSENSDTGIDVTSLFKGRWFFAEREVSIDALVHQLNRATDGLIWDAGDDFILFLRNDSIDLTGKQTFEITITFNDGIVLTQKTDELTLI